MTGLLIRYKVSSRVRLVVEQPKLGASDDDSVSVSGLDASIIHHASTGCGDESSTGASSAVNVVREGEESIASADDVLELFCVLGTFFRAQWCGNLFEDGFPLLALLSTSHGGTLHRAFDEKVDGVALLRTLRALFEGQRENAGMLTQPPVVRLVAGETSAVDARLLACAKTNHTAVKHVADAVGLSVLECERRNSEVEQRVFRDLPTWKRGSEFISRHECTRIYK